MDLKHTFTVPASAEETWRAFNDIEDVAGCFPGAQVTSVEGDDFKGTCKVKIGPISLTYAGSGTFVERDESARRFVLEAKGKDKRGNGTAGATVTAVMTEEAPDRTTVEVDTDLSITGKPAQFGRGVIQDVSDKLLQQFIDCLESKVGAPEPAATETADTAGAADTGAAASSTETAATPGAAQPAEAGGSAAGATAAAGGATAAGTAAGAAGTGAAGTGGAAGAATQDNALDLGATVLPIVLKAYWRQIAAAFAVLLVLRWLARRRKG